MPCGGLWRLRLVCVTHLRFTTDDFTPFPAEESPISNDLLLCKRKQQVPKESPHGGSSYSKDFAEIEIPFQFAVEQIHCQRVNAQTDQGNDEILDVFSPDLRIVALESPNAVEDVVGRGGKDET